MRLMRTAVTSETHKPLVRRDGDLEDRSQSPSCASWQSAGDLERFPLELGWKMAVQGPWWVHMEHMKGRVVSGWNLKCPP